MGDVLSTVSKAKCRVHHSSIAFAGMLAKSMSRFILCLLWQVIAQDGVEACSSFSMLSRDI